MNGQFIPLNGGDPIQLVKERIVIGRRPDCDIYLPHGNVSQKHCELIFDQGAWVVKDLRSTNGVKVNGVRVEQKRLSPGDEVSIARKHNYRIEFALEGYGEFRQDEEDENDNVFKRSLLDRAGLQKHTQFDPLEDED